MMVGHLKRKMSLSYHSTQGRFLSHFHKFIPDLGGNYYCLLIPSLPFPLNQNSLALILERIIGLILLPLVRWFIEVSTKHTKTGLPNPCYTEPFPAASAESLEWNILLKYLALLSWSQIEHSSRLIFHQPLQNWLLLLF